MPARQRSRVQVWSSCMCNFSKEQRKIHISRCDHLENKGVFIFSVCSFGVLLQLEELVGESDVGHYVWRLKYRMYECCSYIRIPHYVCLCSYSPLHSSTCVRNFHTFWWSNVAVMHLFACHWYIYKLYALIVLLWKGLFTNYFHVK